MAKLTYWHDRQLKANARIVKRLSTIQRALTSFNGSGDSGNIQSTDSRTLETMEELIITMIKKYEVKPHA